MILRTVKAFSALGEQGPHFLQKLARIHENREMPTLDRHKSLMRCVDAVDKRPADAGGRREVLGPLDDSCVRAELDNARRTNAKSASRRLAILRPPMTPTPHHTSEKLQAPDKKPKVQALPMYDLG
jgi:hypothetical protein